jgi:type I restriction enzyme S subunit
MSRGSFLEKLLDGVTVEWKRLGEVTEIKRGTSITQKDVTPGEIPVIAGGRTPAYFHNLSNRTGQTIVIAGSGEYAGFVSWWEQPIFVSDAFTVKPFGSLLSKYCFYWLHSKQKQLHEMKSGGGVPHVYPRDVAPLEIPIPCPDDPKKSLAIQAEIVRILDAFTTYTTELNTELTARKKQYAYYRDQLLNFEGKEGKGMSRGSFLEKLLDGVTVEWRPLGEVLVRSKGTNITAGQMRKLHKNGAPVKIFAGGKTIAFVDFEDIPEKHINRRPSIIVKSRGIIEFEYYDKPFSHRNEMWSYYSNNTYINIKFFYYFLKLNESRFQKIGSKMQMPQIATPDTDKFLVPIPCPDNPKKSLEIQAEIVRILDKFDALTTSLTEGLPREIELRQKQYEYYRDKLFTFKEAEHE